MSTPASSPSPADVSEGAETQGREAEHLQLAERREMQARQNYFHGYAFEHRALPGIDLAELVGQLSVPVIAKEIGCGISGSVARQLLGHGIDVIDAAGQGGTSCARIEARRGLGAEAFGAAWTWRRPSPSGPTSEKWPLRFQRLRWSRKRPS